MNRLLACCCSLLALALLSATALRAQTDLPLRTNEAEPSVQQEPSAPAGGEKSSDAAAAPDGADGSGPEFVRTVEFELIRVGCGAFAPEGTWNDAAQQAVVRFNEHGRWRFDPAKPSRGLLAALQRNESRVCPPNCEPESELRGTSCVAIEQSPPASSHLAAPLPPPLPERQAAPSAATVQRVAAPPPPPQREAVRPRPAAAKKAARPGGEQSAQRQTQQRKKTQKTRRQAQPYRQTRPQRRAAPGGCYIDLGYGRRQPCDAGGAP